MPGTNRATGIAWASWLVEETDASGGTATQSMGHDFPYDASNDSEMHCTLILPEDYDDTGSTPAVRISGWSVDLPTTCGGGDPQSGEVTLDVSSRAYAAGELANAAWSTPTSPVIEDEACAFGPEDKVRFASVSAASGASAWDAGDLVFIRIRRLAGSGDWTASFHVARVRLSLPTN